MLDKNAKIGIAGCGGIGSNVAVHLIRSGVQNLVVADFDQIEVGNLNRQFFFYDQIDLPKAKTLKQNLLRIDPKAKIEAHQVFLNQENITSVFKECQLIVEAFDRAESKVMLIETFSETSIPVISASGLAGLNLEAIRRKEIGKNLVVFGDFQSDVKDYKLFSPKIFVVTAMMANEILVRMGFKDEKN